MGSVIVAHRLRWSAGTWSLSCLTRDRIYLFGIARQSLNHRTTREVPIGGLFTFCNAWVSLEQAGTDIGSQKEEVQGKWCVCHVWKTAHTQKHKEDEKVTVSQVLPLREKPPSLLCAFQFSLSTFLKYSFHILNFASRLFSLASQKSCPTQHKTSLQNFLWWFSVVLMVMVVP